MAKENKSGFPVRLGSIDIGSNAIRFSAAEFDDQADFRVLNSERIPVRLGQSVFLCGSFDKKTMDLAVKAIDSFRKKMQALQLERYRAVATSAVRESTNGAYLIEQIRQKTGIEVESISGSEEARLVYLSVKNKVKLGNRKWIMADLGGGSVEVSQITRNRILWTETLALGAVRLLEGLAAFNNDPEKFKKILNDYLSAYKIESLTSRKVRGQTMIATGGNIERIARIAGVEDDPSGNGVIDLKILRRAIDKLSALTVAERMEKYGLMKDRADVILPAAMVYEHLCGLIGSKKIIIPYVGVKDGILFDLAAEISSKQKSSESKEEIAEDACINLGRRYRFDEEHGLHVAKLAVELFDQLKGRYHLNGESRRVLLAGSILHDIGTYINYKGHHKHSLYLILQAELPSFTTNDMKLIANLARYHRKSMPKPDHPAFNSLTGEEKDKVKKLAALIRLADALDREHLQKVKNVRAAVNGHQLELKLNSAGDIGLEKWDLKKKSNMFEEVYGLKVSLDRK
ncbi:MAG TPA: Ppx/GppA phosphatase family protein [Candidatus Omnitrophota bacterium]|nr:Ppx/GppA phosphatase family protein [Candidatus Omnitrophota bacterium]